MAMTSMGPGCLRGLGGSCRLRFGRPFLEEGGRLEHPLGSLELVAGRDLALSLLILRAEGQEEPRELSRDRVDIGGIPSPKAW